MSWFERKSVILAPRQSEGGTYHPGILARFVTLSGDGPISDCSGAKCLVQFGIGENQEEEEVPAGLIVPIEMQSRFDFSDREKQNCYERLRQRATGNWSVEVCQLKGSEGFHHRKHGFNSPQVKAAITKAKTLFTDSMELEDTTAEEEIPISDLIGKRPRRKLAPPDLKAIIRRSTLSKVDYRDPPERKKAGRKRKRSVGCSGAQKGHGLLSPLPTDAMSPQVILKRCDVPENWVPQTSKEETSVISQSLKVAMGLTKGTPELPKGTTGPPKGTTGPTSFKNEP